MVLIVVFFYFNVYLYTLDRNKDFQDVVSRSQQLDADRGSEEATILNAACGDGGGGSIIITFTLINSGSDFLFESFISSRAYLRETGV